MVSRCFGRGVRHYPRKRTRSSELVTDFGRFPFGYHAHVQIRTRPFTALLRPSTCEISDIPDRISGFRANFMDFTDFQAHISRFREGFQWKHTKFQQVADPSALGMSTPRSLQQEVLCFKEHTHFEQLVWAKNRNGYTLPFRGSCNGKVFDTAKSVSHVGILDAYLSRVLCDVRPTDQFNLQLLPFSPTGIRPWYRSCPLGKSKLQQMVK